MGVCFDFIYHAQRVKYHEAVLQPQYLSYFSEFAEFCLFLH
jgi:hypothetical protein